MAAGVVRLCVAVLMAGLLSCQPPGMPDQPDAPPLLLAESFRPDGKPFRILVSVGGCRHYYVINHAATEAEGLFMFSDAWTYDGCLLEIRSTDFRPMTGAPTVPDSAAVTIIMRGRQCLK